MVKENLKDCIDPLSGLGQPPHCNLLPDLEPGFFVHFRKVLVDCTLAALNRGQGSIGLWQVLRKSLLDLSVVGIVCDVVPLIRIFLVVVEFFAACRRNYVLGRDYDQIRESIPDT